LDIRDGVTNTSVIYHPLLLLNEQPTYSRSNVAQIFTVSYPTLRAEKNKSHCNINKVDGKTVSDTPAKGIRDFGNVNVGTLTIHTAVVPTFLTAPASEEAHVACSQLCSVAEKNRAI
jgi:hypothetical protein